MTLDTGATFGMDTLFDSSAIAYKVVSASTVDIAYLDPQHLHHYLPLFPNLQMHLQSLVQQRQTLLFFKTLADFQSIPSHRLQSFLALLQQETIVAGTPLHQSTPSHAGHYWLKQGRIDTDSNGLPHRQIGMDWGHPTPTSQHWTAATDLQVYRLPTDQWENGKAILPELAPNSDENRIHPSAKSNSPKSRISSGAKRSRISEAIHPTFPTPRRSTPYSPPPTPPLSNSPPSTPSPSTPSPNRSKRSDPSTDLHTDDTRSNVFPKPNAKRRHQFWRGYPFIQQQSAADCAVTCLAMIAQYWGKRPSLNTLRELADVSLTGTSLKRLAKASEAIGFQARPVRASLDGLESQPIPWIAHWQGHHYV
ncbi:MAG: hypothetical protein F6K16_37600, partial [Symploca sp. SIO2B6]|nr:hypothetical protein [Symploca sp. SIO2B6]